jgi:hypothetical protein
LKINYTLGVLVMIRKYNYQRLHCNATFPTSFYVLIVSNNHLAFFNNGEALLKQRMSR